MARHSGVAACEAEVTDLPEDQLFEIVARALELPENERDAYLVKACSGDESMLAEARALVIDDVPSGFMVPPAVAPPPSLDGPLRGTSLGDFVLMNEIGRGGMGIVYRARQKGLDRTVAVKVLPAIRLAEPLALERFQREALAASKLRHNALVGVIASGVEDSCAWFAMPLVEGHDLHAELAEQSIGNTSKCIFPAFGTAEYRNVIAGQLARIASGLQHAHDLGVVHRDIKPRNLLLDRSGQMMLADFGLAKVLGDATITEPGALQGTPFYMSPEQARAVRDPIGPRSDVYSLSVVLYELLTLQRPYQGADLQDLLSKIASGTPQKLRSINTRIPRDLAVICEMGMAYRPADRYPSAGEMAADLRRFLAQEAILAKPPPWTRRVGRWLKRNPIKAAVPAALAVVAVTSHFVAKSERQRIVRERIMAPLEALRDSASPSPEQLASAWRAVESMDTPSLTEQEDLDVIRDARAVVEHDIARRISKIDGLIAEGTGPRMDRRYGPNVELQPDATRLVEGLALAKESFGMYPDHVGLAARAKLDAILPRITARVAASMNITEPAVVWAQVWDHATGELGPPQDLGPTPILDLAIPPGSYRFTALLPDGRFSEVERDLVLSPTQTELLFWPRSDDEIQDRLLLLNPSNGQFPGGERVVHCKIPGSGAPLDPYWIGIHELDNGVFVAFLEATNAPVPRGWRDEGFDRPSLTFSGPRVPENFDRPLWLTLPAIGVDYESLRACAEWLGCRVPTHLELEYAHRGDSLLKVPVGFAAPGSPGAPGTYSANLGRTPHPSGSMRPGSYFHGLSQLVPTTLPGARSPRNGLFHALGNVNELTSSRALFADSQGARTVMMVLDDHLSLGCSWQTDPKAANLSLHYTASTSTSNLMTETGLRLARSSSPPL